MSKNDVVMGSGVPVTATAVAVESQQAQLIDFNAVGTEPPAGHFNCYVPALCCACRYDNCDFPACWGVMGYQQCGWFPCCIQRAGVCCKYVENDEKTWCIWGSGMNQVIFPTWNCRCYVQEFCIECVWGYPYETSYLPLNKAIAQVPAAASIDGSQVCNATCCVSDNCFCKFPECCCVSYKKQSCLCFQAEQHQNILICLQAHDKDKDNLCCENSGYCFLTNQCVGIKNMEQSCCIDRRCAIPCDEDVPCIFTFLCPGLVVCVNWEFFVKCCPTYGEIRDHANKRVN